MDELPPEMRARMMRLMGLTPPEDDASRAAKSRIDHALDLLASLGVKRVVYRLDGGGDEGDTTLEEVEYADGRTEDALPEVPTGFGRGGQVETLAEQLENHASDAPDIDWVNNEGGSGTVTYLPMEQDGDRIEVEVYSNPDDDDDEDYDGEDE